MKEKYYKFEAEVSICRRWSRRGSKKLQVRYSWYGEYLDVCALRVERSLARCHCRPCLRCVRVCPGLLGVDDVWWVGLGPGWVRT